MSDETGQRPSSKNTREPLFAATGASSQSTPELYEFGPFRLEPAERKLSRNNEPVVLTPKAFDTLVLLVRNSGHLLEKDGLIRMLWPDSFVEEGNLSNNIFVLRKALGEDPQYIETIPKRGYRFVGAVRQLSILPPRHQEKHQLELASSAAQGSGSIEAPPESSPSDLPKPTTAAGFLPWRKLAADVPSWDLFGMFRSKAVSIIAATALLAVTVVVVLRFGSTRSKPALPAIEVMPLAGLAGFESEPAFSPDGNQVAFALDSIENGGIYTSIPGGERPLRLTNNSTDCCPKWSPDGRQIAFSRASHEDVSIYIIPALGGTEHLLPSSQTTLPPNGRTARTLDWSPDGKILAFTENSADMTQGWISLISLTDSTTRRLTSPPSQSLDYRPAFSPDGATVVFVRGIAPGVVEDLYKVPTAGGELKRLTFDNAWVFGSPAWTSDGRSIVFSSMRAGPASLWRITISGGMPERVPGVGVIAASPSISLRGNQLAYQQMSFKTNIWKLNLRDDKNHPGVPTVVISDKGMQTGRPQFSPDGKRIVFESDRLGYSNIWTCDSNGTNCGQLTSLHGIAGAARWSPDGNYVAFEYRPKAHSEVYLLEVASGVSRLLTTLPGADNGGPNWSRDGKWIYFYSDQGGGPFQIWKIPVSGGSPVQVTKKGGIFGAEAMDGGFFYYSKFESPGIWKMSLGGGDETRILDRPDGEDWWNWTVAQNGIYFLDLSRRPRRPTEPYREPTVKFYDFASGKQTYVCSPRKAYAFGLALSADGNSILYAQREVAESSIMLVKNFR
jgi:Tol biopolymer transport system component/DNA-binding winged helix-turn-helix (wHTH) protein